MPITAKGVARGLLACVSSNTCNLAFIVEHVKSDGSTAGGTGGANIAIEGGVAKLTGSVEVDVPVDSQKRRVWVAVQTKRGDYWGSLEKILLVDESETPDIEKGHKVRYNIEVVLGAAAEYGLEQQQQQGQTQP